MDRGKIIENLNNVPDFVWDVVVIGGGASGLGVALDAISRGYSVLLLEANDFASSTSSKSTKLMHGGVRYLEQGNIGLVKEALLERNRLLINAPNLISKLSFVIPEYNLFEKLKFGIGLNLYDFLAGELNIGKSFSLSKERLFNRIPSIKKEGIRSGHIYFDAQFDDARLAIEIAKVIGQKGGSVLNYFRVTDFLKEKNKLKGLIAKDVLTDKTYSIKGKTIINATGIFANKLIFSDTGLDSDTITFSQGIHITVPKSFFNSDSALLIPKTSDGRVLFVIPWKDHCIIGTTDTEISLPKIHPAPLEGEIEYLLQTVNKYLNSPISKTDILAVFTGIRPLVKKNKSSKQLSRSHKIIHSDSGLISLLGGKWTTFRKMGEDTVDYAIELNQLENKPSTSHQIKIDGSNTEPSLEKAIKEEMVYTLDDYYSRRTRLSFINPLKAKEEAVATSHKMGELLGWSDEQRLKELNDFYSIIENYIPNV